LAAYVSDNKLSWVEDDSNADVSLTRNFLRHKVIPELSARWQGLHHSVQRVAAKQGHTEAALEDVLTGLPDTVALVDLPVEPMVRQAWLRAYLATRGVYTVSDKALAEFDAQSAQSGHAHLSLGSASLRGYAGHLYFEAEQVVEARPQSLVLGQAVTLAYGTLSLEPAEAGSKLAFVYLGPLQVRYRRGGERLRVIAGGQTKTLKQLFAEERVPPWQRGHHPLLYEGEELRCVPGLAVAATTDRSNQGLSKKNGLCEAFWRIE
jgi:tRNA(Ile)-lysidine synthase